jgi:hypothetical protein
MTRSSTENRAVRRFGRIATGLALVLGIAGCTPQGGQAAQPFPEIVWADGEPSGPFDGDTAVVAVRDGLAAMAVASNRNDFRLPELVATVEYDVRSNLWRAAEKRLEDGESTLLAPGPAPFEPTEVVPDGDGWRVRGCVLDEWATPSGAQPTGGAAAMDASGIEYRLTPTDDVLRISAVIVVPALDCASARPSIGIFDPAPVPSGVTDPDDVERPLTDSQTTQRATPK